MHSAFSTPLEPLVTMSDLASLPPHLDNWDPARPSPPPKVEEVKTNSFFYEDPAQDYRQKSDRASSSSSSSPTGKHCPAKDKANHIPRPRNPFMIFRSDLLEKKRISTKVEHDHRQISRIIANYWNNMPEEEKDQWRKKADEEKAAHKIKYPNYRYSPVSRAQKPLKRKTKRNSDQDLSRCKDVAALLMCGKEGKELEQAIHQLDVSVGRDPPPKPSPPPPSFPTKYGEKRSSRSRSPPFKDPLLPPKEVSAPAPAAPQNLSAPRARWNEPISLPYISMAPYERSSTSEVPQLSGPSSAYPMGDWSSLPLAYPSPELPSPDSFISSSPYDHSPVMYQDYTMYPNYGYSSGTSPVDSPYLGTISYPYH